MNEPVYCAVVEQSDAIKGFTGHLAKGPNTQQNYQKKRQTQIKPQKNPLNALINKALGGKWEADLVLIVVLFSWTIAVTVVGSSRGKSWLCSFFFLGPSLQICSFYFAAEKSAGGRCRGEGKHQAKWFRLQKEGIVRGGKKGRERIRLFQKWIEAVFKSQNYL